MNLKKIDHNVKQDFSFFKNNPNLIYLNSSATSLKPDCVIDTMVNIYKENDTSFSRSNSSNNREYVKKTFKVVANHLNASTEDLIINYGTTQAINSLAFKIINNLNDGDEIILGKLEHSSNVLPWIHIAKELNKKIIFKWYILKNWKIDLEHLETIISSKTKLIAISHIYNTVGTKNDLKKIREKIGKKIELFVDGAQAIGHIKIDLKESDVDYYVFGCHKAFGPYGLGFSYIKNLHKKILHPFFYGGGIAQTYDENSISYKEGKIKFMAGTIDIPSIISFQKSIEYIEKYGADQIEKYNNSLKKYAEEKLSSLKNVRIINKDIKSSNLFFEIKNIAGEDVGFHLINKGIILRTGSSCVKMNYGDYEAYKAIRVSFHIYNSIEDVDILYNEIKNGGDFLEALFNKKPPSEFCK